MLSLYKFQIKYGLLINNIDRFVSKILTCEQMTFKNMIFSRCIHWKYLFVLFIRKRKELQQKSRTPVLSSPPREEEPGDDREDEEGEGGSRRPALLF